MNQSIAVLQDGCNQSIRGGEKYQKNNNIMMMTMMLLFLLKVFVLVVFGWWLVMLLLGAFGAIYLSYDQMMKVNTT